MSEYDSQNWNLFRYPLIWFLVAAAFAQITIAVNSAPTYAAPSSISVLNPAPENPRELLEQEAPPKPQVEPPVRQEIKHTIVTVQPAPSRATSPIETVIAFALSQVGKPYRWGAAGPNSYDCSGLVVTAFSKISIRLPHFTGALIGIGRAISRGALQRGDIVFPSRSHVAIYLGNGKMIHAPQPGEVVKVSSVYAFYAARRLL